MTTDLYLAMTAAEFHAETALPPKIAWMACHFSPYALGISNLPTGLPRDSLLILSDIIPFQNHDPRLIVRQLNDCIADRQCRGLLLDLQRQPCPRTRELVRIIAEEMTVPFAVCPAFALDSQYPVFLPPCPPHIPLREYIAPWHGGEIWLEAARNTACLLLTRSGSSVILDSSTVPGSEGFCDEQLHCHYRCEVTPTEARFHLRRTQSDLEALLEEGRKLGIRCFVGLYQELKS